MFLSQNFLNLVLVHKFPLITFWPWPFPKIHILIQSLQNYILNPSLSKIATKSSIFSKITKRLSNPLKVVWRHSNNFQGLSIIFKSTLFAYLYYLHLEWLMCTLCDVCMPCLGLHAHMFVSRLFTPSMFDLHAYMLVSLLMCSTCFMPSSMCLCAPCHVCVHRPRPCLSYHVLLQPFLFCLLHLLVFWPNG